MIEKLKSVLLTALVVASLLQSYLLAYSNPKLEPLNSSQSDYVKTEKLTGTQLDVEDVLFPEQLVLHFGNQQHSVLYPGDLFYPTILEKVKQRWFEGFRKTTLFAAGVNWEDARMKQQGIELRFGHGIPFSVLQKLLQFKGDIPQDDDVITRIWIMVRDNKEDVRTFFFTESANTVYEVVKADFTVKDIEEYLSNSYPQYHATNGVYYLPNQPLSMTRFTAGYTQFTPEQLKQSMFVDPGNTRNLREGDGSVIYTDAKRGLTLNSELHWLSYTDPIAPTDTKVNMRDNLLAAIQFVNQHGGWSGKYLFSQIQQNLSGGGGLTFEFRQYFDRYPIVGTRVESLGPIRMTMQKGLVSGYERSTILLDAHSQEQKPTSIDGGEALDKRLAAYKNKSLIDNVYPAYRSVIGEKTVELIPEWAVELRDGTVDFLP